MRTFKQFTLNPAVDIAGAYSAGDQLGPAATKLTDVVSPGGLILLSSIAVIDKAMQSPGIEFLFWDSLPVVASADNAAISIVDAEAIKCVGRVVLPTTSYRTVTAASVGSMYNIQHLLFASMEISKRAANFDGKSLWFTMVVTSTPTFVATTDLVIRMGFEV